MYKIGDFIIKANTGVCKITDISCLDISGIDSNTLYYHLLPLGDKKTIIYIPKASAHLTIRKMMTKEEALELIHLAGQVDNLDISNDKFREQKYRELLKHNSPIELLQIIKTTYLRKKSRTDQGKKCTSADESYFKLAEKLLLSELCIVLEKSADEIRELLKLSLLINQ